MLSEETFLKWQALMVEKAGQYFSPNKNYLFRQRLTGLYDETDERGLDLLYDQVMAAQADGTLLRAVIEAMTTHETQFFRDGAPFDLFRHLLRERFKHRNQVGTPTLNIFSAGCSTGEETLSLAMVLDQELSAHPDRPWHIRAWDIAEETLKKAHQALFFNLEKRLEWDLIDRYFEKKLGGMQLIPKLRKHICFENKNLMEVGQLQQRFDFIFCRYVGIYFSKESRETLFRDLTNKLVEGGVLMVGASESIRGLNDVLERREHRAIYYYCRR